MIAKEWQNKATPYEPPSGLKRAYTGEDDSPPSQCAFMNMNNPLKTCFTSQQKAELSELYYDRRKLSRPSPQVCMHKRTKPLSL